MTETAITITGNLVADPELRFTPAGQPVATFRVASTPRYRDNATGEWKDGDSLFLTCVAWRQMAENIAESLARGARVIVSGRCVSGRTRPGKARSGPSTSSRPTRWGPSLRNAAAKVTRATRSGGAGNGGQGQGEAGPWASDSAGGYPDRPPF